MKQLGFDRRTFKILLLGYLLISLLGGAALCLPLAHTRPITFLDAFFTATSAVSMTGIIVKNTATDFSALGQLIILALIQIGGLGYIGLGFFGYVLLRKKMGLGAKNLLKESLSYYSTEGLWPFFKQVLVFILIIEFAGAALLSLRFALDLPLGEAIWQGIFHSISAFNNAGFSLLPDNLARYKHDVAVNLIITTLIIIGGLGYFVLIELYFFRKKRTPLSLHSRIVLFATGALIVLSTLIIFLFEYSNPKSLGEFSLFDKVLASYFAAINYRTAGFNTLDLSALKDASLFFGSLFMVIGGAPGGTAGGMKITTLVVLLLYAYWTVKNAPTKILRHEIPKETLEKAFIIAISSAVYIIICVIILSLLEDFKFIALLFEVCSAFATVGVSVGDGGTLSLSALFNEPGKLLIIMLMLGGRIGIFALLVAIFSQERQSHVKYPEGKIYL